MADPRSQPEPEDEDGASPGELLIEAARRNNTELLQEVIDGAGSPEKAAVLLNETKTPMGNHIYHEAALRGNYEVIDLLLDQEGFECDPLNRVEGDTPLHSAVRYINSLPLNADTAEFASGLISMMIDAGSDPRIKNRALLTPSQLVDPANVALRRQLADAIDIAQNAGDFVEQADIVDEEEEDLPDEYEGSDSDFDPEEYEREKERRRKAKENKGLM
ncbi:hypothetical protein M430DRAFT_26519 [Amorphotheca resinae ATCC 22711]|uniref:Uncharacterized protein n=1 Tax=Amorphotheca resinae ATCC 22711 TaxID=857342 RepID=A0A2T3B5E8_AMORE|nr:hypothetical protein M430DRAFT_26519 [Amorphotheca resinae ATCC 22711]PSS21985.1 hypothetical protein M430DRAFT_26519 [Amorphotheca resinae ATCC 22711]